MTSEGQYAGQQPGATSGGGADPFGTDAFPPDLDGQQAADRAPSYPHAQESFPSAYGPPPHATPNGGSPFVVPAVPPAGQTPAPGSPAPQPPGPAFGPGAAKFSASASASARVPAPEPGLPQRSAAPGGAFPAPESAWAPPPSAQPSPAAEDNPFAPRAADSHPYRAGAGAGDLPQRSPGIAGGPLDGPVGDFNGFAPARKAAEPAPPARPDLSRRAPDEQRAPFERPGTFGAPQYPADSTPAPQQPFGSAAPQAFGSARPDDADESNRAPGVSAFGDQRIRVPGATLTGLPDGSTADGSGLPPRGADAGGLPPRDGLGRSRGGSESGGFPLRGGGNASFPIRGGPDSTSVGFSSRSGPVSGGGALPARGAFDTPGSPDSGGFPTRAPFGEADSGPHGGGAFSPRNDAGGDPLGARIDSDSNPFAPRGGTDGFATPNSSDSGGFPVRSNFDAPASSDNGSFPVRGASDSGGFPARGASDSGGFPVRGAFDSPADDGQSASARSPHPYGDRPGEPDGSGAYPQRIPGTSFAVAGSPDLNRPDGGSGGYAQRVPGAAYGSGGAPVVESRSAASVPQPREKPERLEPADSAAEPPGSAKGTARPVTASASVPVSSRVAPPPEAEELPPPQANPQSRVYGRPAPAEEAPAAPAHPYQAEDHSAGAFGSTPASGARRAAPTSGAMGAAPTSGAYGQAPENPQGESPYGRASEGLYAPQAESPSAAPADGTYGRPAPDSGEGTYGRPAEAPFGTRPSSGASGPAGLFDGGAPDAGPAFGATPASGSDHPPERASGRATASARVSPPGQPFTPPTPDEQQEDRGPQAFSEFTADIAGRGQPVPGNPAGRTMPPDQYGENTTDMAGRNQPSDRPYVPAPALPTMHAAPPLENGFPPATAPDATQPFGERPRMGGLFPGPASRATVTPPGPEQTASWPSRQEPEEPAQGRFDSFKQDPSEVVSTVAAKPETPHVRMLPVILGVILGAGLIVGLTLGVTWLIARGSHDGNTGGTTGFSVKAGDCVKREGTAAVTANCSDAGSFEVTAIAATKEECPDPNQPYVVNPTDKNGGTQVLCLKPRS